jgi:hypothetical protein
VLLVLLLLLLLWRVAVVVALLRCQGLAPLSTPAGLPEAASLAAA